MKIRSRLVKSIFISTLSFLTIYATDTLTKEFTLDNALEIQDKKISNRLTDLTSLAKTAENKIFLENPAARYCQELGYTYKTRKETGGAAGYCIFNDKKECEAWAFLSGNCGEEFSYCHKKGYGLKTVKDKQFFMSPEYAVCTDNKKEVGAALELMGIANRVAIDTKDKTQTLKTSDDRDKNLPAVHDWRDVEGINYLTSVKDVGYCGGAGGIFTVLDTVEAAYNIQNNRHIDADLSEQAIISCCPDCSMTEGNMCNSGSRPGDAFLYLENIGVPDEACFPYTNFDSSCSEKCSDSDQRLKTVDATFYGENVSDNDLKYDLVNFGPVMAYLNFSSEYVDGEVFRCTDDTNLTYAFPLVGYNDNEGYWIMKGHFSKYWPYGDMNDNGYIKVAYGECGIGKLVFSPETTWTQRECDNPDELKYRKGYWRDGTEDFERFSDEGCFNSDDCVLNGQLYFGGDNYYDSTVHDIPDVGTNKFATCNNVNSDEYSAWYNLDSFRNYCEEIGAHWHVDKGDADIENEYNPNLGQEADNNYCAFNIANDSDDKTTKSTECCCGDDIGEYFIEGNDGSAACCDQQNECVVNGVCLNHEPSQEICTDGIDNDCDGLVDCKDPECDGYQIPTTWSDPQTYEFDVPADGSFFDFIIYDGDTLNKTSISLDFKGEFWAYDMPLYTYEIIIATLYDSEWSYRLYGSCIYGTCTWYTGSSWVEDIGGGFYRFSIQHKISFNKIKIMLKPIGEQHHFTFINFEYSSSNPIECGNGICEGALVCDSDSGAVPVCSTRNQQVAPCLYCDSNSYPYSTQEVCGDGQDNDCDGLIDCEDSDCFNQGGEDCSDGIDNDCDGKIDCQDEECDGLTYGTCGSNHPTCAGFYTCMSSLNRIEPTCSTSGTPVEPDPRDGKDPANSGCPHCDVNGNVANNCPNID